MRLFHGPPLTTALGTIPRVEPLRAAQQVEDEFPELFNGLRCLTDNYKIQLNGDAQPLAITTTPRRVAIIPLLPKVKAELQ